MSLRYVPCAALAASHGAIRTIATISTIVAQASTRSEVRRSGLCDHPVRRAIRLAHMA
jgi:hypothetical protein